MPSIRQTTNSPNGRFPNTQVTSTQIPAQFLVIPELPQATMVSDVNNAVQDLNDHYNRTTAQVGKNSALTPLPTASWNDQINSASQLLFDCLVAAQLSELVWKLQQTSMTLQYFLLSTAPSASLATAPDNDGTKAVYALGNRRALLNIPAAQSSILGGSRPPDENNNNKAKPQGSILSQERTPNPSALTRITRTPQDESIAL